MIKLSSTLLLPTEISGRRTAIFGLSGSGKSNTATVIIEGLIAAGEQVVMIDPKGEGWGLLSLANGKPSNLDVLIFGEPHGHITELNETHGPMLADFVVDSGRSVVLSLLGFTYQAERRFVTAFLLQLSRRKSRAKEKTRTLVVFDEARLFVPENARGDVAELSGAVQRIARLGRSSGLGSMFIDQRPQQVAKSVISQVETIICHQLSHKTDRTALSEWVAGYDTDGRGEQFLNSLASLLPGQAWIWSPAWLKLFQQSSIMRRKTYDSGAAPDEATRTEVKRAAVDIDKLRGQLAEIVDKAKENDPAELKKQIAELTKRVKQTEKQDTAGLITEVALRQAVTARDKEWETVVKTRDATIRELHSHLNEIVGIAQQGPGPVLKALPSDRQIVIAPAPTSPPRRKAWYEKPLVPTGTETGRAASNRSPVVDVNKCSKAILQVLSQFTEGCYRGKLVLLTGYKYSGSFKNSLSALRTGGLITGDNNGVMQITEDGMNCGPFPELPAGQALVDHWLNFKQFSKCAREILAALLDNPDGLTKDELCDMTSYNYSGSFKNSLSALRTAGLITGQNNDRMKADAVLLEAKHG